MAEITCPKCKAKSGDDWSQCRGECPMPMSPQNRSELIDKIKAASSQNMTQEACNSQAERIADAILGARPHICHERAK